MSKLGKKLIAAVKRHHETVVTQSCGCVFCDIGLEPVNGEHEVPSDNVVVLCSLTTSKSPP